MFQTVMVPLDGSSLAEQAIPVAVMLAGRAGATVHLVSVQAPVPALPLAEQPQVADTIRGEVREQTQEYLFSTRQALADQHDLRVVCAVLDGQLDAALADYVDAHDVSLIVMTTHGRSGISRLWLGSVADQLLRSVAIPVLLLRSGEDRPHAEFRSMLIALDGSPAGETVLEPALALGLVSGATQYLLVRVIEPPIPIVTRMAVHPRHLPPHWTEQQTAAAKVYLASVADRLRKRGMSVSEQVVVGRGIGERLIETAGANGVDLVALGTQGLRGAARLMLGSVADKVVRGATCPVLVVPLDSERAPRESRET